MDQDASYDVVSVGEIVSTSRLGPELYQAEQAHHLSKAYSPQSYTQGRVQVQDAQSRKMRKSKSKIQTNI